MLLAAACALAACGNARRSAPETAVPACPAAESAPAVSDMHTAENALDYPGTYEGTLPAADCPGIETSLTLTADGRYSLHMKYLERDAVFDEEGTFTIDGNLLTVKPSNGGTSTCYKVGENRLQLLDADRKPIPGKLADRYVLTKKQETK